MASFEPTRKLYESFDFPVPTWTVCQTCWRSNNCVYDREELWNWLYKDIDRVQGKCPCPSIFYIHIFTFADTRQCFQFCLIQEQRELQTWTISFVHKEGDWYENMIELYTIPGETITPWLKAYSQGIWFWWHFCWRQTRRDTDYLESRYPGTEKSIKLSMHIRTNLNLFR